MCQYSSQKFWFLINLSPLFSYIMSEPTLSAHAHGTARADTDLRDLSQINRRLETFAEVNLLPVNHAKTTSIRPLSVPR